MKRRAWIIVGAFLLGTYAASAQSVAEVARANRKKAKQADAVKHYDNDNLPKEDHLSVVGPPPAEEKNTETPDKPADSASAEAKPTSGSADQAAANWKNKIQAQRDKVDSLSKELDITQREYRLRTVAMYSDAGNRLRNSTQWDKEDAQYKQQIGEKQKSLDEAKKTLDDMMEDARKAGVSSGQLK
jgi:hypothetical protein